MGNCDACGSDKRIKFSSFCPACLPPVDRPSLRTLVGKSNLVGAEIGVGEGANSLNILKNLDIRTLYCIDPYEQFGLGKEYYSTRSDKPEVQSMIGYGTVSTTLSGFEDKVVQLLLTSNEAASKISDKELDFVYIDGDHEYLSVRRDIELYWPKVKIGGLVAGHDYNGKPVRDAVEDELAKLGVSHESAKIESNRRTQDWWVVRS